jgi:hypothetical protein
MTTITIQIPDAEADRLRKVANKKDITLEELIVDVTVKIGLTEYGYANEESVAKAIDYVMTKNHELYKRLS